MKRLLIAAGLAAGLHGLLLGLGDKKWFSPTPRAFKNRPVTVTLESSTTEAEPAEREPSKTEPAEKRKPEAPAAPPREIVPEKQKHSVEPRPRQRVKKETPENPEPLARRSPAEEQPAGEEPLKSVTGKQPQGARNREAEPKVPQKERTASQSAGQRRGRSSAKETGSVQKARPLYKLNPPPRYPSLARRRAYEGTVLLEVLVDEDGRVGDLRVAASSGHSLLDQAALKAVRRWRFEPGRRGSQHIAMWVKVPVRFALQEEKSR